MNQPPYFIEVVLKEVTALTKEELELDTLWFDFGPVEELNTKVQKIKGDARYPFIWLLTPFTLTTGESFDYYATTPLRILFVNTSAKDVYAPERFAKNYRGTLGAIKDKFVEVLNDHEAIKREIARACQETFRAYWGISQSQAIDDKVDMLEISQLPITINNNQNC